MDKLLRVAASVLSEFRGRAASQSCYFNALLEGPGTSLPRDLTRSEELSKPSGMRAIHRNSQGLIFLWTLGRLRTPVGADANRGTSRSGICLSDCKVSSHVHVSARCETPSDTVGIKLADGKTTPTSEPAKGIGEPGGQAGQIVEGEAVGIVEVALFARRRSSRSCIWINQRAQDFRQHGLCRPLLASDHQVERC